MSFLNRRGFLAGSLLLASPSWASTFKPSAEDQDRFLATLKTPGHTLILRHALAPGHNDPTDFALGDCGTQRNLDDVGRAQAVEIGNWLRDRDLEPSAVYTSQWCRCVDTANLMDIGPVVPSPALNSFSDVSGTESEKMRRLHRFMVEAATKGGPSVMVTHTSNASRLIGGLLGSGEGAAVRVNPDGTVALIGRMLFGMERV